MTSYSSTRQQGLSLIELMIAVVLGLIITTGLIQLFTTSKQNYRVQENLSRLQENGRFAMNFISQDIRMADYWGCISSSTSIENNLHPGSVFDNSQNAIDGSNNDGLNNSDSISLSRMIPSQIFIKNVADDPSAKLQVTDNSPLKKDDIVLVSDCSVGDIFQISADPGANNELEHELVVNAPVPKAPIYPGNQDSALQKRYNTDAQVYEMQYSTYSIATGKNGQPSLFKSSNGNAAVELIEGIENMQILYGEDTDIPPDNSPNYYVPAETAGLNMDNVISIRVSLVAVTLDDFLSLEAMSYTIFGEKTTPDDPDRKIRRVFTSTIAVRNRLP